MTRDTWIGVVVLGFAVLYWVGADGIRISPLDGPVGAAGLPKALAYALGGLAVLLLVRSLAIKWGAATQAEAPKQGDAAEVPHEPSTRQQHLRALGMLVLGLGYLLLIPYLGYTLSVIGLLLAVALYIGAKPGLKTLAVAGIGGVLFYLLFVRFLHIPLPAGIWPSILPSLQG
jgi:hypothetical protein